MNRAGNAINHPETIGPDPHTPGSPLPRAEFCNSVGYLPDGTAMNAAGALVKGGGPGEERQAILRGLQMKEFRCIFWKQVDKSQCCFLFYVTIWSTKSHKKCNFSTRWAPTSDKWS